MATPGVGPEAHRAHRPLGSAAARELALVEEQAEHPVVHRGSVLGEIAFE
ncbi:MAG: hypothetical protein M3N11_01540 [Actinomycetota bacterium]|nr:hypothetical protein [Actinomycetota bacterium]